MRERYGIEMSSGWREVTIFKGDYGEEGLAFWVAFPLLLDSITKVYIKERVYCIRGKLARYNPTTCR